MSQPTTPPGFGARDFLSEWRDTLSVTRSEELPPRTIVAPADFVEQIRRELGAIDIQILTGDTQAVLLSSDLYDAFQAWNCPKDP